MSIEFKTQGVDSAKPQETITVYQMYPFGPWNIGNPRFAFDKITKSSFKELNDNLNKFYYGKKDHIKRAYAEEFI